MSETVEVEVGDLYAELHDQFSEQVGEEYDAAIRQQVENFLHQLNQQMDE